NLPTVAFPGSGLNPNVLYPSANRRLAEKIIDSGGALVSEYPPEQMATLYTFPQRNRLMAGLARATLIIEAGKKSGTLITARLATEYNRDVLAVPGSIFSPNSYGSNWLIKQGATPITEAEDILKHFSLKQESFDFGSAEKLADLSPAEKKIVDLLKIEPLPRDELVFKTKISVSEANTLLSIMEIKGLIKESLGEFHLN
ncbi:MAG: DNA-processing protein DprA, partial [Candidatus Vogelbacteria bacterium]|nr:DNA-processing protein DprA [Candidatus Vogelbacteria bacterium]